MEVKNNYGLRDASWRQSALPYQEDEVRPLVVEGDRRMAERGVVGALRGRMPERLTRQLGVVQLLFKVCSTTQTHRTHSFNISVSRPLHGKHANLLQIFHLPTQEQRSSSSAELNCGPKV